MKNGAEIQAEGLDRFEGGSEEKDCVVIGMRGTMRRIIFAVIVLLTLTSCRSADDDEKLMRFLVEMHQKILKLDADKFRLHMEIEAIKKRLDVLSDREETEDAIEELEGKAAALEEELLNALKKVPKAQNGQKDDNDDE